MRRSGVRTTFPSHPPCSQPAPGPSYLLSSSFASTRLVRSPSEHPPPFPPQHPSPSSREPHWIAIRLASGPFHGLPSGKQSRTSQKVGSKRRRLDEPFNIISCAGFHAQEWKARRNPLGWLVLGGFPAKAHTPPAPSVLLGGACRSKSVRRMAAAWNILVPMENSSLPHGPDATVSARRMTTENSTYSVPTRSDGAASPRGQNNSRTRATCISVGLLHLSHTVLM